MKKDIETDLISVIVPIFNVEAYLRPCIESILASTYTTLQIILVNDGSTEHSGEICDEYTRKDTRIEVIHQKNAGLSPARNSGMKAAKGKYISFIDGDDYIHPQMYEVLLEALQEGNYSFSMILGKQVYDNDKSYSIPSAYTKSILTQEIMIKSLFNHIHQQQGIKEVQAQVVWNKLYKRELLDNEFFQETGTEDTEFNCRIYQKSCQAVIIDIPMYYWVQRPTSITHQKVNPRYIDRADSYYLCLQNIPKENTVYRGCCLEKLFKMIINVRYHASNTPYRHLAHLTAKRLKKQTANEFLKNRHIPFHIKLSLLSFYYIPPLYSGFMKLCETKARKK